MRSAFVSLSALALLACAAPESQQASPTQMPTPTTQTGSSYEIALYREIAKEDGNQFVSPLSVQSAFALLYPGARGATAEEIARVFGYEGTPEDLAAAIRARDAALEAGDHLRIANAGWAERSFALDPAYLAIVRDRMGATFEPLDFRGASQASRTRINTWVAQATQDRIRDLLGPDVITAATRLVLTNAIYFKADWADQFAANRTFDGQFHLAGGGETPARLMRQTTNARYFETDSFQAAEFDYAGGDFALDVYLPRERDGIRAFDQSLTGAAFRQWTDELSNAPHAELLLTLPKVQMESTYDLIAPLRAMGVRAVFSASDSNLSGLTSAEDLLVTNVIHKTFLAIDEKGTEAAAATAIVIAPTAAMPSPRPDPIVFNADHPFFIALRHKATGAIVFLGRVTRV